MPAIQIWLTILANWPAPGAPTSVTARPKLCATGLMASKTAGSPPHMMVSTPLTAPACPPETGASTKFRPSSLACA
ncbi:hypothetical protein G6F62_015752 [Rhizopus arrhizus]|nr:hypothetical protein G6F62_015752 [Rhizopus arrhizus]